MSLKRAGICLLFAVFLMSCGDNKPLRILSPETFGLTCVSNGICIEDLGRLNEATQLRDDALGFMSNTFGALEQPPRLLFCVTQECFAQFGNPEVAALYFWGLNSVIINDKGWQDYILRHELIHHWQVEQFGVVRAASLPKWYIEGMAYSMSRDPRDPLPRSDIDAWRDEFEAWVAAGNDWRIPPR